LAHGRGCKLFRRLRRRSEECKVLLTSPPFHSSSNCLRRN
jgi:hypothetical protein